MQGWISSREKYIATKLLKVFKFFMIKNHHDDLTSDMRSTFNLKYLVSQGTGTR